MADMTGCHGFDRRFCHSYQIGPFRHIITKSCLHATDDGFSCGKRDWDPGHDLRVMMKDMLTKLGEKHPKLMRPN
ncbi:MAG: hypothetical protein CMM54_03865 [Rhodospirillaceae bacterium]|nr:hypothetical protein [Rhodospirillaceae bacterium]